MLSSESGVAYQSWREKSPSCSCVRTYLRMPFSKFVIQYQTCTATTTGIDHTSTSDDVSTIRTKPETRTASSANSVPSTMVRPTLTTVKIAVLSSVCQKTGSCRIEP